MQSKKFEYIMKFLIRKIHQFLEKYDFFYFTNNSVLTMLPQCCMLHVSKMLYIVVGIDLLWICCGNVFLTLSQRIFFIATFLQHCENIYTTFYEAQRCGNVIWGGHLNVLATLQVNDLATLQVNVVATLHNVSCNVAKML